MFACITENLEVSDDHILAYSVTLLLKGGALESLQFLDLHHANMGAGHNLAPQNICHEVAAFLNNVKSLLWHSKCNLAVTENKTTVLQE